MAARQARLSLIFAILVLAFPDATRAGRTPLPEPQLAERAGRPPQTADVTPPARIVSLVPALTEMLFAIGAGPQVAGVSSYDTFPPEVQKLPRVGALLDPDTERILALRPDMVLVYGSQSDAEARFARAGIRTYSYRHGGIVRILESIRELGALTGRSADAARVATELQSRIDGVRARVKGRRRPRTLVVMERQPKTLRNMYVSGGTGFLNEILEAAGGINVFADAARESAQPSQELLLARAPEVIIEVRAVGLAGDRDREEARASWATLSSIPAVRDGRIHSLVGEALVVPGPRLGQGAETIARALHPDAFTDTRPGGR